MVTKRVGVAVAAAGTVARSPQPHQIATVAAAAQAMARRVILPPDPSGAPKAVLPGPPPDRPRTMAQEYVVTMATRHSGAARDEKAREQLAATLPEAEVGEFDENGVFDITIQADDLEQALQRSWDAVAASGTDDHLVFLEHPDLPEHWRRVSGPAAGPA